MNRCPRCGASATVGGCDACGFRPVLVDGFTAFAPELAHDTTGFDPAHFSELAELEAGNFWFRARNALILHAFARHCAGSPNWLEIGCGTGYVLSAIASRFPQLECWGSEVSVEGLAFAAARVPGATLVQMDARNIPFADAFHAIGAFDVLEHIEDDTAVLAQVQRALVGGGHVLLTVPQHPWLWSAQDERAHHMRRYARGELERKLHDAGLQVRCSTSFVSLLLPALFLSRLGRAQPARDSFAEFRIPRWLDAVFLGVMWLERCMITAGVRLPVGGSRLVVARKPE